MPGTREGRFPGHGPEIVKIVRPALFQCEHYEVSCTRASTKCPGDPTPSAHTYRLFRLLKSGAEKPGAKRWNYTAQLGRVNSLLHVFPLVIDLFPVHDVRADRMRARICVLRLFSEAISARLCRRDPVENSPGRSLRIFLETGTALRCLPNRLLRLLLVRLALRDGPGWHSPYSAARPRSASSGTFC